MLRRLKSCARALSWHAHACEATCVSAVEARSRVGFAAGFRSRHAVLSGLERSRAPVRPEPLRAPTLEKAAPAR